MTTSAQRHQIAVNELIGFVNRGQNATIKGARKDFDVLAKEIINRLALTERMI